MTSAAAATPETHRLHKLLEPVIFKAWRGDSSPVKLKATHEACHVARFVHGAPPGIVNAIKSFNGVSSAVVQGVFCHKKPLVFWEDGRDATGLSRRELADLMVEVTINSKTGSASRALLVQVKMGKQANWATPATVNRLEAGQRRLYAGLPPFCLELDPAHATKQDLLARGVKTFAGAIGLPLHPYHLSPALLASPSAGCVYAAVDRRHRATVPSAHPWLGEVRPPHSSATSGVFVVDFAWALADMIVEAQPAFGVRSDGSAPSGDWARLIADLKSFASARPSKQVWRGRNVLDIELRTPPNQKVLNHIAKFVTLDNRLSTLWSYAGTQPINAIPWFDVPFDMGMAQWKRLSRGESTVIFLDDEGRIPPGWDDVIPEGPRGGFGWLSISIELE